MFYRNEVEQAGHLSKIALQSGENPFITGTIAVPDNYFDEEKVDETTKQPGVWVERTDFIKFVSFNPKLIDKVKDGYIRKGQHVVLEGKLKTRTQDVNGQQWEVLQLHAKKITLTAPQNTGNNG